MIQGDDILLRNLTRVIRQAPCWQRRLPYYLLSFPYLIYIYRWNISFLQDTLFCLFSVSKRYKRVIHNKFIIRYLRISKLLCTFAVELRNMFNQLNFQAMQEDLESEIERKKREPKTFSESWNSLVFRRRKSKRDLIISWMTFQDWWKKRK